MKRKLQVALIAAAALAFLALSGVSAGITGVGWVLAAVAVGSCATLWLVRALPRTPAPQPVPVSGRASEDKESEALSDWLRMLDRAPVALIEVRAGTLFWANATACRWLSLDLQRHAGLPVLWFLPYPSWWESVRAAAEGISVSWQHEGETIVWRLRWMQHSPARPVDGVLWIEDWTERQRVEAMRRDFVANVSHELRTPLTVLIGALETLSERDFPIDTQMRRELIALGERQAQQMLRLVRDLLQLAELEGGTPPAKGWVAVADLIEEAVEVGRALAPAALSVAEALADEVAEAELYADATEMGSALRNLVTNAVRYTPSPGQVTIGARLQQGQLLLFVADTGIGIAAEHIPRLTERFYRVDRARSRASGGTGLGLAIVRHIADRHEAQLRITSQVGQGSCFALEFPSKCWRKRAHSDPVSYNSRKENQQ